MNDSRYGAGAVRELIREHGFRFSRSMGQNFLVDANIPEKIVRLSGVDSSCGVLEVGPGMGALTSELSLVAARVIAVELDGRLLPILRDWFVDLSNVEFVQGDILKLDIKKLVNEKMAGLKYHVCANLPYNITTPALTAFINAGVFESITVMVQREVARRICAKAGVSDYGAFTVFVNYHMEPEMLFDVPPECFFPRPKVYSSVVTMKRRGERLLMPEDEAMFFRVVRAAFGQRRKTLLNALHAGFGSLLQKPEVEEIIKNSGFDPRIRGETLNIEEFARLSEGFKSKLTMEN